MNEPRCHERPPGPTTSPGHPWHCAVRLRADPLQEDDASAVRCALVKLARGLSPDATLVVAGSGDYLLALPGWPPERALLVGRLMRAVALGAVGQGLRGDVLHLSVVGGLEAAMRLRDELHRTGGTVTVLVDDGSTLASNAPRTRRHRHR